MSTGPPRGYTAPCTRQRVLLGTFKHILFHCSAPAFRANLASLALHCARGARWQCVGGVGGVGEGGEGGLGRVFHLFSVRLSGGAPLVRPETANGILTADTLPYTLDNHCPTERPVPLSVLILLTPPRWRHHHCRRPMRASTSLDRWNRCLVMTNSLSPIRRPLHPFRRPPLSRKVRRCVHRARVSTSTRSRSPSTRLTPPFSAEESGCGEAVDARAASCRIL